MELGTLLEYLAIVRRRLWLILLMLGLTLTVVLLRSVTAKPMYSASVLLNVSTPGRDEMTIFGQYNTTNPRDEIGEAKANFMDMVKLESVARRTIQSLGLIIRPSTLVENLSVEAQPGTNFVVVSLKGESPEQAQAVVNAHVETTLKFIGTLRSGPTASVRELISKRLASTATELNAANEALRNFRVKKSISDLSQETMARQSVITSLYLEREKAYAAGDTRLASAYDAAIKQREDEVRSLSALSSEHDTLLAKVEQIEGTYKFLLEKESEAKLKEDQASAVGYIQILELAQKPEHPTSQRTFSFAIMGSVVSIIAGVMLIFLWEYVANLSTQVRQPVTAMAKIRPRRPLRQEEG